MEEVGLHIVFEELKIRGSNEVQYLVRATEEGDGSIEVNDTISVDSWEKCQQQYPTLQHLLQEFSYSHNWEAGWRYNERILFIESIVGHEGLYSFEQAVEYQCGTEIISDNKDKSKTKKVKSKKV